MTLFSPTSFIQDWVNFYTPRMKAGGYAAAHADAAMTVVDVRDIVEAAATVLTDPAAYAGKTYPLSGGEALSTGNEWP